SLPILNSWPSGSTTLMTRPRFAPLFASPVIVTVTSSPALNDLAVMPKLMSVDGLFHSPIHCTTLPFSSLESNFRNECGLVQRHSVTTPLIVTVLLSYEAFP